MNVERGWRLGMFTFLFLFCIASTALAADTPPGTRQATEDDLGWMRWAGIPDPRVGMPINPDDPTIGKLAGETKLWLAQHATRNANISCINPQFAEKLKKFMEAVPGGPPVITDGYRGTAAQQRALSSGASRVGACGSYHNYGFAADFNNARGQTIQWMRANSRNFGIATIGAWDPGHFQNVGGVSGQCGACANDAGGGMLASVGGVGAPTSGLANAIRNALGLNPPPPPPPPPPIQQPLPQAQQQTLQSAFQFATSTSPSNLPTSVSSQINTNQNTNTNNSGSGTSTFDLIDQYANPVSQFIDIGTATPIALNPNTSDIATLQGTRPDSGNGYTTGTVTTIQPTNAPQTFISGDLANSYISPSASGQNSSILGLLNTLKNALVYALNYLKPFGGQVPGRGMQTGYLE